ncbi:MAG TPA: metallophosphoesterase family protein [Solirubrobacteraceae bacterium]|nr:metallophosphoesterase family protein [Solirubrobacteraceae bacterium]
MRIAVVSDTHLPRGTRRLPAQAWELLAGAQLILHAGDIATREVLEEIEALGPPVHAVCGNVDEPALALTLPERRILDVGDGQTVGLVHDAGPATGRLERLRGWFPLAGAVIFGHSHVPLHERSGDFQIFNPGSPTDRRRQPAHTMGLLHVTAGGLRFEHVVLD